MPLDIMVDLETMGTRGDTAFVSIGAVAFDPYAQGGVEAVGPKSFYRNVDVQTCIDAGLRVDGGTIMWWLTQGDAARQALTDPKPVPLAQALQEFAAWANRHHTRYKTCYWSHGATFDLPIITEAAQRVGVKMPWQFWECNDTRTVYRLAGQKLPPADFRSGGHNSLHDAVAQALHLQRCIAALKGLSASEPALGEIEELVL